jgi:serine/threonine protein phosphatase PrpC
MEDACSSQGNFAGPGTQYYGLFDGHGGSEAAIYCATKLHRLISQLYKPGEPVGPAIKEAIYEINREVISQWEIAGTTAAIVVIADGMIYAANVGDSRVILIEGGRARRLTFDHKATIPTERRDVISRGGTVIQGRVNGILMLSRAIGDGEIARYITCEPHLAAVPLTDGQKLIIACDGVWDVMTDQMAADIYNNSDGPINAARAIKAEALKRGTMDNVSVMCIDLRRKAETAIQRAPKM